MIITIDQKIKKMTPNFSIGVLTFQASTTETRSMQQVIEQTEYDIANSYTLETLLQTPKIKDARDAYKTYGKDPSRYRLAVESLFRRIIKGQKLYRINNLVDVGNILSLTLKKSTAVLDRNKIQGDIHVRLGLKEPYEGIARGHINIENIPVYVDQMGPFGSTTSDTTRTMITETTTSVLMFIISFTGSLELDEDIAIAKSMLQTYTNAKNIETLIVK